MRYNFSCDPFKGMELVLPPKKCMDACFFGGSSNLFLLVNGFSLADLPPVPTRHNIY